MGKVTTVGKCTIRREIAHVTDSIARETCLAAAGNRRPTITAVVRTNNNHIIAASHIVDSTIGITVCPKAYTPVAKLAGIISYRRA